MKKILSLVTAIFLAFPLSASCVVADKKITIGVMTIIEILPLQDVWEGINKSLTKAGYQEGKNITILHENAHGNAALAVQIAKRFVDMDPHPDVIVAIGTISAQAALSATKMVKIPVVIAAVSDPVGSKLVPSLEAHNVLVTGTTDRPPIAEQIALIRTFMEANGKPYPKIGIVYNPGETNSTYQVAQFKKLAAKNNLTVLARGADSTGKVATTVQSLLEKVDALYIPQDNTVVASLANVIRNANIHKTPVFGPDPEAVYVGAVATIGFTHIEEGELAGNLLVKLLQGTPATELPISTPSKLGVYVNLQSLETLNMTLPPSFKNSNVITTR